MHNLIKLDMVVLKPDYAFSVARWRWTKIGAKLDKNILGDLNKREYSFYLFIHSRSDSKTGYLVEPWRETVKKYTFQPF